MIGEPQPRSPSGGSKASRTSGRRSALGRPETADSSDCSLQTGRSDLDLERQQGGTDLAYGSTLLRRALICRGNADVLCQRCAATDKRSPIAGPNERPLIGIGSSSGSGHTPTSHNAELSRRTLFVGVRRGGDGWVKQGQACTCRQYCLRIQFLPVLCFKKRTAMRHALRQHYRPHSLRVPVWLRRVWAWL